MSPSPSNPQSRDGIVANWFLTGGAWASEPGSDPLQEHCRLALKELLAAAAAAGVAQADCDELVGLLKTDASAPRAMVLAVLIAGEIPENVVARVTDIHLAAFEAPSHGVLQ